MTSAMEYPFVFQKIVWKMHIVFDWLIFSFAGIAAKLGITAMGMPDNCLLVCCRGRLMVVAAG